MTQRSGHSLLRILTYNVAGVPFALPMRRRERFLKIASRLRELDYDVVAFQEVWFEKDARLLQEVSGYSHAAYHKNRIPFGDGLLTLSRYPIKQKNFYPFTAWDIPWFKSDKWVRKGALACRIQREGGEVDIYNTHFVNSTLDHFHIRIGRSQIERLAEGVRWFSGARPCVIAGDFNLQPQDETYFELARKLGMRDAYPPEEAVSARKTHPEGRIDYIFIPQSTPRDGVAWVRNEFVEEEGAKRFSLSDHVGVGAGLRADALVASKA